MTSFPRRFYNPSGDSTGAVSWTKQYASIIEFDEELGQWHKTVPPFLQYGKDVRAYEDNGFRGQFTRLHCQ